MCILNKRREMLNKRREMLNVESSFSEGLCGHWKSMHP